MLVSTWLSGIGLEYALPSFEAAGIVTPTALAELSITHFEALGIVQPEDRRKLFYLVQRIKQKVEQKDDSLDAVDAVLAQTSPRNANYRKNNNNNETSDGFLAQDEKSTTSHSITSFSRKNCKENRNMNGIASRTQIARSSESSVSLTEPGRTTRKSDADKSLNKNLKPVVVEPLNNEEVGWYQDSGDSADDEASSVPGVNNSRRQSRRTQEKKQRHSFDSSSVSSSTSASSCKRTSSLALPTARWSTSSSTCKTLTQPFHIDEGNLESSSNSETNHVKSRKGKNVVSVSNNNRRLECREPRSMRTGKLLSTIPSHSIAPMSPLVELVQPAAEENLQRRPVRKLRTCSRRPNSHDTNDVTNDSSIALSPRREGTSSDSDAKYHADRGHVTMRQRCVITSGKIGGLNRSFNDTAHIPSLPSRPVTPKRSSTPKRNIGRHETYSPSSPSSRQPLTQRSQSDGTVSRTCTFQGRKEDDSFKAQIAQLREDNNADHEIFGIPKWENSDTMRIRVVVRKRPMSRNEIAATGDVDVIHPLDYGEYGKTLVYQPKIRVDLTKEIDTVAFAFDNVFDEKASNADLYTRTVRNLIPPLFEGQWASVFAYGQTGSGKTFTMMGSNFTTATAKVSVGVDRLNLGLYYMAALDIFHAIKQPEFQAFSVSVSLFEIYGGKLYDLLNKRTTVKCLEDSKGKVCFPGLSEHAVPTPDHLIELIEEGAAYRSTGTTSRNADSSRSHAVLQIHLGKLGDRRKMIEKSRLTFIDLAGSERGIDTAAASRATRIEGAEINSSLLALKEVIRALASGDSLTRVPFRTSKLTQVLKESFVGKNCQSVMIACISPNIGNCEQTLNTLRYADRVKERNSDTGQLSQAVLEKNKHLCSSKMSSINSHTSFVMNDQLLLASELQPTHIDESIEYGSQNSVLLDELLNDESCDNLLEEVDHSSHDEETFVNNDKQSDDTIDMTRAVAQLISSHKAAMSSMLDMVKEEMALVSNADVERHSLDSYFARLIALQNQQLEYVATMREHLLNYHLAKRKMSVDSFEDLRD